VPFAEIWNGRLAMLGFVIGLAAELLSGQGSLAQLGWQRQQVDRKSPKILK
jgi:ferrochelatase